MKLFQLAIMSGTLGTIAFYFAIIFCVMLSFAYCVTFNNEEREAQHEAESRGLQVLDYGNKLVVTKVAKGSPAQKSGIEVGDVIRDINERSVSSFAAETVSRLLGDKDYSAGSVVSFKIKRPDFDHKTSLRVAVIRAPLTTVKDQQLDDTPENVTAGSNQMPNAAMRVPSTTLRTDVRASTLQQT